MNSKCDKPKMKRERIDVPFTPEELSAYQLFLTTTGRKKAPWVKSLILQSMAIEPRGVGALLPAHEEARS